MSLNRFLPSVAALALALSVAACGTGGTDDAEQLDQEILGEADNSDPALTEALENQIMVDPELTGESNTNSALPGDAVRGAPVPDTLHSVADAQRAIGQGRLLSAPEPTEADEECTSCQGRSAARGETTLGALAERQANEPQFRECPEPVTYGMEWAERLPRAFDVYPRGEVLEAAGKDTPGCRIRVVSFRTNAGMQRLLDWYYTRAIRSGYSSEHQIRHGNHVLGGYREQGELAYYIIFAPRPGGGTDVDIIANQPD